MASAPIEDYALIGDSETAALVRRDGSIDWLCLPRFDSAACFAALLGDENNGRWLLTPASTPTKTTRCYRGDTMVLETVHETATGTVAVIDFMVPRNDAPELIRIVEGRSGSVAMRTELIMRFDYGESVPWVRRTADGIVAVAGPDQLRITTSVPLLGENFRSVGDFEVRAGQRVTFELMWSPSHLEPPAALDPSHALETTLAWWEQWSRKATLPGPHRELSMRSLLVLKALTYAPTGAIVAAPTTSLPEHIGGVRNWDYRFCWLRDATFTLYALLNSGYRDEARAWRDWLVRAVAGRPDQTRIMYGIGGERRLTELELPWLAGYADSKPVRIGNGAAGQFQLDVFGEVMDTLHLARRLGLDGDGDAWRVQRGFANFVEQVWTQPDEGIWEIRGPRRHFTYSKVMAWVALDRAVTSVEEFGLDGPARRWRKARDEIHAAVCRDGYSAKLGSFVQAFGEEHLDASLLLLPALGFLPPDDPRIVGTIEAIERELMHDGFVLRYRTDEGVDGLPSGEGAFLACSFWLVDAYVLIGRQADAEALFERLSGLANDVGLIAEEYDPVAKRLLGNFPQALSHIALVNSARNLSDATRPCEGRGA
ncbi:MAG: glycoside hydrolase family 15 protein [Deltaproteobacteria bacterium]|nr:glycoside hydrolase family 15 protein [Nannocystaceae bacterium]